MARKKRKTPGINGSSSADIAFMLLIFFLITTSMDTDKGLKRRLPPLSEKQQNKPDVEINDRNIMRLLVNRQDKIVIFKRGGGAAGDRTIPVKLEDLKDIAVRFITNPNNSPDLPEKEVREIPYLGTMNVTTSSYAISLKNEVETSYQMYINVQNELLRAYNEVWDALAKEKFRMSFEELSAAKQKAIVEAYPMHISEMPLSNLSK
ncbi:biopolymer transporter ExbD [Porphyromonas crevioricanis]|uniref:Biopolymer transport protein ExbD/TolR n=2 Tax=Porphyromonas crevioricanis TaxID=393921 RepID=A0A0A2FLP5_9PORP|nr:biopolymer transporter ExbD [Porphyromonas crevioricanis]KGN90950.1 biopolymer transporter ExbD [Porphyromonas crevioricanis]KGN95046.1 biopolymer transporter ExbD [Porphyromonas crevioricanis]SJZ54167.1 Biopolymer transport protein ExbD/TolR [Porphyromonas crevioricanis]SQH73275.1 Biopolymer transport protein ExbD/TolR [Porphyromonas crevioricanis]GAD06259.1 biopolymer transport exbD protein [Porphyromonas crevioricanis JCM 15906]